MENIPEYIYSTILQNKELFKYTESLYYDIKEHNIKVEGIKLVKENIIEASIDEGFVVRELILKIKDKLFSINFIETYDGIEILEDDKYKSKEVKCYLVKNYK